MSCSWGIMEVVLPSSPFSRLCEEMCWWGGANCRMARGSARRRLGRRRAPDTALADPRLAVFFCRATPVRGRGGLSWPRRSQPTGLPGREEVAGPRSRKGPTSRRDQGRERPSPELSPREAIQKQPSPEKSHGRNGRGRHQASDLLHKSCLPFLPSPTRLFFCS